MLRLRQHVCRHEGGVLLVVCDDEDLRRPGEHIDAHLPVHFLFGEGDEDVARAGDDVHFRDALGAVGKGGDGLRTPHFEDLFGAADIRRRDDGGVHLAVFGGGRHPDVRHARGLGGQHAHQYRAEQRRGAAGHVDARPLDGAHDVAGRAAVLGAHVVAHGVALVVGEHVGRRLFDRGEQGGVERGVRLADLVAGDEHGAVVEHAAVEPLAVDEERAVALFAHLLQDGADARRDGRVVLLAALQDARGSFAVCI